MFSGGAWSDRRDPRSARPRAGRPFSCTTRQSQDVPRQVPMTAHGAVMCGDWSARNGGEGATRVAVAARLAARLRPAIAGARLLTGITSGVRSRDDDIVLAHESSMQYIMSVGPHLITTEFLTSPSFPPSTACARARAPARACRAERLCRRRSRRRPSSAPGRTRTTRARTRARGCRARTGPSRCLARGAFGGATGPWRGALYLDFGELEHGALRGAGPGGGGHWRHSASQPPAPLCSRR